MKALVTGSNGFLGRRLVQKLEQEGHEVTGLDLPQGNIEDPHLVQSACQDVDVVFPLPVGPVESTMPLVRLACVRYRFSTSAGMPTPLSATASS